MKETNNFNRRKFLTAGALAFAGVLSDSTVAKSIGDSFF